jgi:nucleoside-diphosphate-sugar epimerase
MRNIKGVDKIIVSKNCSLKSLMKKIDRTGFDFFIITDRNKKLLGVVTEGDIRRGILKGAALFDTVSSIMNPKPVSIVKGEEDKLFTLFKTKNVVGKIPVTDKEGRVIDLALDMRDHAITFNQMEKPPHDHGKVLVIGGAGYIGSVLVRKLLMRGYKVRVLDALLYGDDSIKELKKNKDFEFIKGDTRNIADLTNSMQGVGAVIHLAELVGDPLCAKDAKTTKDINLFATSLIGQICKQFLINRLIYASSGSVYGANKNEKLLDEKSPLEPLSIYAKTKLASEQSLLLLADDVFAPCILRLSTVYGLSYRPRFDLVVNTLTAAAYFKGRISVHGGSQWRPLVHVSDVSEAIIRVLEAPINKIRAQTFNVGCEEQNQQIISIAKKVKEQLPKTELTVMSGMTDPRNYKVSFAKIRNTLGFRPKKNIREGIKELIIAFDKGKITDYTKQKYRNS